ncbi:MAG: hypothetical protein E7175_01010 [Erysipelotrichaceae bacterium]|nr:hypothetical protein [Erysipelotrichaceae bacterium]
MNNPKSIFNATVCLIGVLILLVHIVNILLKKHKRKDEYTLLNFFIFTAIHFASYFTFVLINNYLVETGQQNEAFIITSYTVFYIMNNIEVFLFYLYMTRFVNHESKTKRILDIVNISLFSLIVISDIVNIFTHMYFNGEGGVYHRGAMIMMIVSQLYQFIILAISFFYVLFQKELTKREKIGFSIYVILPALSIVLQNLMPGYAIAYVTLLLAIEILFLFINVEKNIRLEEGERKLEDANIKIMMSQIRPHFIYNTLSSISTLITIDPDKAQKALDDFTDYLRANFSALTQTSLIPFNDELKHINTYVNLEQMRFNDRLSVVYDIQVADFYIPALSIQPFVENAIKHGVLKKIEGGEVTLKTYEDDTAIYVEVIDDGVGFDMNDIDFKGNKHIGLNNVRHRIASMCKGDVKFESEVGKGTKVTITFYK